MTKEQDTRLRKAGRWGLYGAGGAAAGYGLLGLGLARDWRLATALGVRGAIRGGAVGAGLGALTYRRKQVQELSNKLDDLIRFDAASENIERIKEHAQRESAKTALELVYEKLLKSEKPRVRLSSKLDELIEFQDTRPRSPVTGEFQPQGEGGPSPNAMATVYKAPQPDQGRMGAGKFAGAALAGGALGAIGAQAGKAGWQQAAKAVRRLAARRKSVLIH
jgi:hypothetical protein